MCHILGFENSETVAVFLSFELILIFDWLTDWHMGLLTERSVAQPVDLYPFQGGDEGTGLMLDSHFSPHDDSLRR